MQILRPGLSYYCSPSGQAQKVEGLGQTKVQGESKIINNKNFIQRKHAFYEKLHINRLHGEINSFKEISNTTITKAK